MTEQQHTITPPTNWRTMLTTNTEQLKQRVAEHVAADSIIQGAYWDTENMRGCFIGCLAHDDDPRISEVTYGLPVIVQRIAENIFEALPIAEAKVFFAALPGAVGCDGKDLTKVGWQFLAAELRSLPEQSAEVQAVIDPVIAGMDKLASGQEWPAELAESAGVAAASAWWTSAAAADAAWWVSVAAWWASGAAAADWWAPAVAARAATRAATRAAEAVGAARAAAVRLRQRDLLLRLIAEAPVVEQLDD